MTATGTASIPTTELKQLIMNALAEDQGTGDITSMLTIPPDCTIAASMVTRSAGILAGMPVVHEVYRQLNPNVRVHECCSDGCKLVPGTVLCTITGDARAILTGERVALNFVQRLSATATLTRAFVERIQGTSARIVDTRKTTPGLRALEKYAVRCGGGNNHRFGLYDAVLIKDNHIAACGSISEAVGRARDGAPHTMTITVECDSYEQVQEALDAGTDIVLLDNMTLDDLRRSVASIGSRAIAEASGGITLDNVAEIAQTGVDIISVGALTHSAGSLDIGLDIVMQP